MNELKVFVQTPVDELRKLTKAELIERIGILERHRYSAGLQLLDMESDLQGLTERDRQQGSEIAEARGEAFAMEKAFKHVVASLEQG